MHDHDERRRFGSPHTIMMVIMVVLAVALLLGGASAIVLLPLVLCGLMMALMMRGMDHGRGDGD